MPPRWLSIAIVAFWLGTTGWLFYQDVWPSLLPGQPPPYTIDLEDEVQTQHAHWIVSYNDRPFLRAETWVTYDRDADLFGLHAHAWQPSVPLDARGDPSGGLITVRDFRSDYTVTRGGDLRTVSVVFSVEAHDPTGLLTVPAGGKLTGEVRDDKFFSHLHASTELLGGKALDRDLDPVAVSGHGSVLSPLHPVNRIAGLQFGQRWRAPLVDPVKDALAALVRDSPLGDLTGLEGDAGEIVLNASVRPKVERLEREGKPPAECLVIDYAQAGQTVAGTWVEVGSGLVLRQESERGGEKVAMDRE